MLIDAVTLCQRGLPALLVFSNGGEDVAYERSCSGPFALQHSRRQLDLVEWLAGQHSAASMAAVCNPLETHIPHNLKGKHQFRLLRVLEIRLQVAERMPLTGMVSKALSFPKATGVYCTSQIPWI